MTTLAIIGAGIVGRSLLYNLAKEQKNFEKITLIYSDKFTPPCTQSSTAVVAPRGITRGHSPLGDLICDGFEAFREHVNLDRPSGVEKITQITVDSEKPAAFKKRYPHASPRPSVLKSVQEVAIDEAFGIDPDLYSDWLLDEAQSTEQYHLECLTDLVVEVEEKERLHLRTLNGRRLAFDHVVFAGGNYNRFWSKLGQDSKLSSSKPVQGSYLEFRNQHFEHDSFSLTLNGDNLIWSKTYRRLLIGSSSEDQGHFLPPRRELRAIHRRLSEAVALELPTFEEGIIRTGLREKASGRAPYAFHKGRLHFIGGLYKNGYSLALHLTKKFTEGLN